MSHITREQRYTIEVLLSGGEWQASIARAMGRSWSEVSREVMRNCDQRSEQYRAELVQRKASIPAVHGPHSGLRGTDAAGSPLEG